MSEAYWEHFEHEADIGIRGVAPTLAGAFEQAALAMMAVITEPGCVTDEIEFKLECSAPSSEYLFVEWLNQLIYLMATEHVLFSVFHVQITGNQLSATVRGELLDRDRHHPAVEIKGATLTELAVDQQKNGLWSAQTVVDV